jgi:hypothetical protein
MMTLVSFTTALCGVLQLLLTDDLSKSLCSCCWLMMTLVSSTTALCGVLQLLLTDDLGKFYNCSLWGFAVVAGCKFYNCSLWGLLQLLLAVSQGNIGRTLQLLSQAL